MHQCNVRNHEAQMFWWSWQPHKLSRKQFALLKAGTYLFKYQLLHLPILYPYFIFRSRKISIRKNVEKRNLTSIFKFSKRWSRCFKVVLYTFNFSRKRKHSPLSNENIIFHKASSGFLAVNFRNGRSKNHKRCKLLY